MAWAWVKKFLFSFDDESKSEVDEEIRIYNEIQEAIEEEDNVVKEIGIVTLVKNGSVEINKTWLASEGMLALKVGSLVSYCKPKNPESNIVTNIELLKNVDQRTTIENTISSFQGIISYIDEEKLLLNPGSLLIWKNNVEVNFTPQPGDYIKLKNFEDNLKLLPQDCKIVTVEVTEWDGKQGFLNGHIKISLEVCENFYTPKEGDTVVSCIISCSGNGYQWRSLNVSQIDSKIFKTNRKIEIKNIPVFIVSVGKEKVIEVPVKNISTKPIEIRRVHIYPKLTNVTLLNNPIKQIEPGIALTYKILCTGEVLGWTYFKLEFKFKNFVYLKSVKFLTVEESEFEQNSTQEDEGSWKMTLVDQSRKPNFLRVKPKTYEIPSYLLEICGCEEDVLNCMSLIQEKIPSLREGLTMDNYALFYHTLLFLEEIAQIHQMEKMETVAPIIRRGQYYVFTFEEGTIYSSLCPGDTVMLSNPWVEDDSDSPVVIKVCMRKENEIYLNFKDVYHVIGNRGTLLRMNFRSNRTCIVRTHHAIDYFLKQINVMWLFPQISNKKIYAETRYDSHSYWQPSDQDEYFFKELNKEQKNAVDNIVFATDNYNYPYLLFGPPGTGKTFTLVEATLQTILHVPDSKILIAAPSNSAVDTFCELLVSSGIVNSEDFLRLLSFSYSQQGHLPVSLVEYSAVSSSVPTEGIRYCDSEDIGKYKIVAGTLSTLGILNCVGFRSGHFTHVFIDEAGQTTEPESLIPLAGMKPGRTRIVLAGDPNQLGPVILSRVAKEYGLGDSLMMRLMSYPMYSRFFESIECSYKPRVATMLRRNYRSLPSLVELTSSLFYKNQLVAMISNSSREADVLNEIKKTSFGTSGSSLIIVRVNGKEALMKGEGNSYSNLMEAATVSRLVSELYKVGITAQQIGVITPYCSQVKEIRRCFTSLKVDPPKVGTVEEFQGSERDIIIISLVRTSLDECRLSFISEPKRTNVALSRAKVMNLIVANVSTLRMSRLWEQVLNKAELTGEC